ncbi:amino acid transporter [Corynebacterium sp. AOP40-9SA-29]|uniref:amino acid transporter n=1 Tax=Corynebacterium sp. AOP40-9SA-29 TaxID=3457677 RepID=UPI0040344A47
MCLSGVDYFSTLGYQPGIAVAAAGALAPVATLVLVAVTLLGAVPVYRRIAAESPDGLGSVGMLAAMVRGWRGKLLVLVLLGFAACDFMITVTLSASDAATHLLSSSTSPWLMPVTLMLVGLLAAVFLKGFTEAVRVSVVLVGTYLALTTAVVVAGLWRILTEPGYVADWTAALSAQHNSVWAMAAVAVLVFPKLALGLSGFETGVSVMPLIRPGPETDPRADPATEPGTAARDSRIRGGRRLVLVSALVMSAFLVASSLCVTMLVPAGQLASGGEANGRALAWLAHEQFGPIVGNLYDASTIAVLWFAGASAMAGMLALIPRYLPAYGMAPRWARRSRPMVVVLTGVAVLLVLLFRANVDAQSGAYATGVLVLLFSGALAVTLHTRHSSSRRAILFALVTVVLGYTLVANIVERPEGLRVAAWFIMGIIVVSAVSRTRRSLELRGTEIRYDAAAQHILQAAAAGTGELHLVASCAQDAAGDGAGDVAARERGVRRANHLPADRALVFLEVSVTDASDFTSVLEVTGRAVDGVPVLNVTATTMPNAIAAVALDAREHVGVVPDLYFEWGTGTPVREMLRYLAVGRGHNAAVTREVLRRVEPDEARRPRVHVG